MNKPFDRAAFFSSIRGDLFKSGLQQLQVSRIDDIIDELCRAHLEHAAWAYVLATAHHETMQFIYYREIGGDDYFRRMYDIQGDRPDKAERLGNTSPGDGVRYHGRGAVHITGRDNYARMGRRLGINLVESPELAEQPDIAARILVMGMAEGMFRGRKLSEFFSESRADFYNAREIVNAGHDKAKEIAGYAGIYLSAVKAGFASVSVQQSAPVVPVPMEPPAPAIPPPNLVVTDDPICAPVPPVPPVPWPEPVLPWHAGWKTHVGMLISGVIGLAAMLGYIPGMTAAEGANMLETAFAVSGTRSAIPVIIKMAVIFYIQQRASSR